ncbi:hypothetical protein OIU76_029059 [Salix suchowensis]|nr:hypothetical protein OIU76_029059 [Salix suchowensis]
MRKIALSSQNLPLKRGAWSPEEDQKLISHINRHGIWNWIELPKAAVIPTAPKILKPEDSAGSPKTNISSSFNLVNHLIFNENQVIEENVGLLESTGEQCLRGPQFSAESQTCRVEDYGDTCTVEMWVQELLHGV